VATSEVIHVAVAAAGLAALFAAAPAAFTIVRVLGAIYLVYLGVQMIRHRGGAHDLPASGTGMPGRRAYVLGLTTNLLNPKMVVFTIAFLPQFVHPRVGPVWVQFAILGAILGAILVVLEFVVDGTVGVLAGRIGGFLRRRRAVRRRVDATTGGIFVGLGVKLAVEP
jgi:threonine/homoserine/homoserine lactone efflux protein